VAVVLTAGMLKGTDCDCDPNRDDGGGEDHVSVKSTSFSDSPPPSASLKYTGRLGRVYPRPSSISSDTSSSNE